MPNDKEIEKSGIDRRRYIRLNSVFPVEFSLYFILTKPISEEYQAFTSNVSEGGICISVRNLKSEDEQLILKQKPKLKLTINIPIFAKPVSATSAIAWIKTDETDPDHKTYLIGLSYEEIEVKDRQRILNYARKLIWVPRAAFAAILVLLVFSLGLLVNHIQIRKENFALVKRLVEVSDERTTIAKQLKDIRSQRGELEGKVKTGYGEIETLKAEITGIASLTDSEKQRISAELDRAVAAKNAAGASTDLDKKIEVMRMELAEIERKGKDKTDTLDKKIKDLETENNALRETILSTEKGEQTLESRLAELKAKSGGIEQANMNKMIQWVKVHQVKKTGLVISYEGDENVKDYGFTYDQALSCQLFLVAGEKARAAAVLNFYNSQAQKEEGLYFNAYDTKSGAPREYTIHSGPNIWIGISACQYTYQTGDRQFLPVAEGIAAVMLKMQAGSKDGGIPGGPKNNWVSTEHNLDGYALFNMLYQLTNETKYSDAAAVSLNWLKDIGYNKQEGRFGRGRGDSTIATDTFSWGIAAIGPAKLNELGMSPDGIMEFAENACMVQTKFYRPENTSIDIVGFDFAKPQNLSRGGIVSTEWTGQMIVAFKIMADYYKEKGEAGKENIYRQKADYYLSQLSKMTISSPSATGQGEGCLPYASIDDVDTGHGWRVAKGRRTGSVAGTVYYIFASKGYDPLSFKPKEA